MEQVKDIAPFTASDLQKVVKALRNFRSMMWNQAQNDGRLDYAMQYYEVVSTLIYGVYFIWDLKSATIIQYTIKGRFMSR